MASSSHGRAYDVGSFEAGKPIGKMQAISMSPRYPARNRSPIRNQTRARRAISQMSSHCPTWGIISDGLLRHDPVPVQLHRPDLVIDGVVFNHRL